VDESAPTPLGFGLPGCDLPFVCIFSIPPLPSLRLAFDLPSLPRQGQGLLRPGRWPALPHLPRPFALSPLRGTGGRGNHSHRRGAPHPIPTLVHQFPNLRPPGLGPEDDPMGPKAIRIFDLQYPHPPRTFVIHRKCSHTLSFKRARWTTLSGRIRTPHRCAWATYQAAFFRAIPVNSLSLPDWSWQGQDSRPSRPPEGSPGEGTGRKWECHPPPRFT
jgi:hypothetical protein